MLDKLNDKSTTGDKMLEKYFDAENIQYWLAFQILMGNIDNQNRNMFLYSPQNGTRWYILPWDLDDSLRKGERELRRSGALGQNSWRYGVSNYWGNLLFQRLLKSERFRTGLDKVVDKLYRNQLSPNSIGDLSKQYANIVKPYLSRMLDVERMPIKEEQYDKILNELPKEVEKIIKIIKIVCSLLNHFILTSQKLRMGNWFLSGCHHTILTIKKSLIM